MLLTTWSALAASLVALTLEADPVVLGEDNEVNIDISDVGDAQQAPALEVSLGTVSAPRLVGPGTYRATYTPPAGRAGGVAIFLARLPGPRTEQHAWLAVPLLQRQILDVATKANMRVWVRVAGQQIGPIASAARGPTRVPLLIPPGATAATIIFGKPRSPMRKLTRRLPPTEAFPMVRLAVSRQQVTSTKGPPVDVEVFAITPRGEPRTTAKGLYVRGPQGNVGPLRPAGPGVFRGRYRVATTMRGSVSLQAGIVGAAAQRDQATITLVPAAPTSSPQAQPLLSHVPAAPTTIDVSVSPDVLVAGTMTPVEISTRLLDPHGNTVAVDAALTYAADFGSIDATYLPGRAKLYVPDFFDGHRDVAVHVTAGTLSGVAHVTLHPGPPTSGRMQITAPRLAAGVPNAVEVFLRDDFGNPVDKAALHVSSPAGGEARDIVDHGGGHYALSYVFPDGNSAIGASKLQVEAGEPAMSLSTDLTVMPPRVPWQLSLGLMAMGHSNFAAGKAGGGLAEVALRTPLTALEVLVQGGMIFYVNMPLRTSRAADGSIKNVSMSARGLAAGARLSLPVIARAEVHIGAVAGAQQGSHAQVKGATADQLSALQRWLPSVAAIGGTAIYVGPGRIVAEVRVSYTPITGTLTGDLGGIGCEVGYLFAL